MKQEEEKQLLLVDLCGRLPYEVKVKIGNNSYIVKGIDKKVNDDGDWVNCVCSYGISPVEIEFCKPYLFPISTMSDEQYENFLLTNSKITLNGVICSTKGFEFLNKHHFDYRGLISMGLANDATGLNIY